MTVLLDETNLWRPRMYKTRFYAWGVKKYRVDTTIKALNRKTRQHLERLKDCRMLDTAELQQGLQDIAFTSHQGPDTPEAARGLYNSPFEYLDVPPSSNGSSHRSRATSSTVHTPARSRVTSTPSSSDRSSMFTPSSSESGEEQNVSPGAISDSNFALVSHRTLPDNGSHSEVCITTPGRASGIPCSVPESSMYFTGTKDSALVGQIVDQTMGLSWPSLFSIPTPSDEFQGLMAAPIDWSTYHSETPAQNLGHMRGLCSNEALDFVSPLPETWTSLCFYINILLGQGKYAEATQARRRAMMIYQMLVQDENDQLLSILNVVLANLFLHGQAALAAELLGLAKTAASAYLDQNDAIIVSIEFMIAMALRTPENCGIKILKLRQVAEDMRRVWGENHRYCITADYHLAWRLAMESDLRLEALNILRQTQGRAEQVFAPEHTQTIALITTQARVLGHLGHHIEAERTMLDALRRIRSWDVDEDYPYLVEAERRYKVFVSELARVRSR